LGPHVRQAQHRSLSEPGASAIREITAQAAESAEKIELNIIVVPALEVLGPDEQPTATVRKSQISPISERV
jgi:hypothetical protein